MSRRPPETLRAALAAAGVPETSRLDDGVVSVPLAEAAAFTPFGSARPALRGRTILLAASTQLETALALIDLDGWARRIVLLPPDIGEHQLAAIIRDSGAEAVVCSSHEHCAGHGLPLHIMSAARLEARRDEDQPFATEWLMLTSGTTGDPKLAIHSLAGLTGAIAPLPEGAPRPLWATFYDIRRYGGLQIFLRAMLCGGSLILSRPGEAVADHLTRLAKAHVTHVSGTPSHWRRVLMTKSETHFAPAYVRLSGEIADQAVLDALKATFPDASIGHAYASTEAGVGFDVNDGLEGFPASYLDAPRNGVELRIVDGCLQLHSPRRASGYAGRPDLVLADAEGWVDSGDMVEIREGRCHFVGRRSGVINVGGLKVHPEEIEAVIARHEAVRIAKVRPRKSPIIGNIVVADIVLREESADAEAVRSGILGLCRSALPAHKVPAMVNIVASIGMTAGGKIARSDA